MHTIWSHANSSQWTSTGTACCWRFLCTAKGREPFFCMQTVFVWQWLAYLPYPTFILLVDHCQSVMKWPFWGNSSPGPMYAGWAQASITILREILGIILYPTKRFILISWYILVFLMKCGPRWGLKVANNIRRPNDFLANFPSRKIYRKAQSAGWTLVSWIFSFNPVNARTSWGAGDGLSMRVELDQDESISSL